ncbi:MAG: hypothetical protein A2015_04585 [Spirochaetes bacterium GWF1_31_7]|nr:MAG: hypothetical protein A2Y30_16685 [Spirochaetes bacterium GWE1_32_154]OHD45120.1 MAG: hypothetical protein A2Y29_16060 [Spirochaetes bacterium GWE2_31_10]OHD52996.1 MAG: hypothetical protein A2015_04585 [Spirochaetes bacterium GWF1_31_7]OHD77922.1 MAG: hypothetical protein A2355_03685 [Spirochaetes bacterium RIFOXYB1_FULL_32_8]HBD95847.1 response regulator [Spirochaetia bacterium]
MMPKILIVDDIVLNIQVAAGVLQEYNYEILTATGGEQAIKIIKAKKPDLILLDIMMPDIDGFDVIKSIKESSETSDIPVIFVTAKNDIETLVAGFNAGAVDYITKPFNPFELYARVRAHLELKMAKTELEAKNKELQQALNDIKTLEGLIPICANCKKIKDDDGYWHSVEEYMTEHSDVKFTHGLCNDCIKKLYPEFAEEILSELK